MERQDHWGKKEEEEKHEVLQNHHNMSKMQRSREAPLPVKITSIFIKFHQKCFLIKANYFRMHEYHYGKYSWNLVGIYSCWRCLERTFKRQLLWVRVGCQLGKGKKV